jgi:predicted DNA-binding antitoxin AbrB/MazE fold protein
MDLNSTGNVELQCLSEATRMTQIDAIYRDGIFQPLEPVQLADEQRVRLSIEPIARQSPQAWLTHVRELQANVISRVGLLPDSSVEIAADRLR